VPAEEKSALARPAAGYKALETVPERIEPQEKICPTAVKKWRWVVRERAL